MLWHFPPCLLFNTSYKLINCTLFLQAFLIKNFLSTSKDKDGQDVALLKLDEDEGQAGPLPAKTGAAVLNI